MKLLRVRFRHPVLQRPYDRLSLVLAFLVKTVWNIPTTAALMGFQRSAAAPRRLCGWEGASDVPSESTFSRASRAFAEGDLPGTVHGAMVREHTRGPQVCHVSLDSTAIEAREAPAPKEPEPPKGLPNRLDAQGGHDLAENLADLPARCAKGAQRSPKGHMWTWCGFKLHLAVADVGLPVVAMITSASASGARFRT
jgi:hypothetical protein